MLILDEHTVCLQAGEPIPVHCECGRIYSPALGSEMSDCPGCGRANVHAVQHEWAMIGDADAG